MLGLTINYHLSFAIMFNDVKQTYEIKKLDKNWTLLMVWSIGKDLIYHCEGLGFNSLYLQHMCMFRRLG